MGNESAGTNAQQPYLSLVATSRNDDHGGRLLHRMQIFIDGFVEQCERHGLDAELILVEWNPPAARPRLVDALEWPSSPGRCRVRIVEVPAEVHRHFRYSDCLPLFQMIAKNAGIRRARGRFVLATNVDILFSDELIRFLAARRLDPGRMYRIDRHDVMSDVPGEASLDEQLAYCRTHLLRVNAREGSFALTPNGERALERADIATPDSGLRFGQGWFPLGSDGSYRWARHRAELLVGANGSSDVLTMDLEVGQSPPATLRLRVKDAAGGTVAAGTVTGHERLFFKVPPVRQGMEVFLIESEGPGMEWTGDPPGRVVMYRVRHCGWASQADYERADRGDGWQNLRAGVRPWFPRRRTALHAPLAGSTVPIDSVSIHTNACGDFTLLSRDRWLGLRGYPEFELFSFHLDSVFCYSTHYGGVAEVVLEEPMRIYHVEHEAGSGWTPEGHEKLFQRLSELRLESLDEGTVLTWARQMRRFGKPMIFNDEAWGLAAFDLPEVNPGV